MNTAQNVKQNTFYRYYIKYKTYKGYIKKMSITKK